jgi:hypothetical protein
MNERKFTLILLVLIIGLSVLIALSIQLWHPFLPKDWTKTIDQSPYLFPLILFVSVMIIVFSIAGLVLVAMNHGTKSNKIKRNGK